MNWIIAVGAAVVFSALMGFGGLAAPNDEDARGLAASNKAGMAPSLGASDEGEARAAQYYGQKGPCVIVVQYGEKPAPIGPMTGDPEKDTYAYPVKRTDNVCTAVRP